MRLSFFCDCPLLSLLARSIITVFRIVELVSAFSARILITGFLCCLIILLLFVWKKGVIIKLLEGVLLDLIEWEMSLIVDPEVLVASITRRLVIAWCELVVRVILLVMSGCIFLIRLGAWGGGRMLPEKVLFEPLVLFAHSTGLYL